MALLVKTKLLFIFDTDYETVAFIRIKLNLQNEYNRVYLHFKIC